MESTRHLNSSVYGALWKTNIVTARHRELWFSFTLLKQQPYKRNATFSLLNSNDSILSSREFKPSPFFSSKKELFRCKNSCFNKSRSFDLITNIRSNIRFGTKAFQSEATEGRNKKETDDTGSSADKPKAFQQENAAYDISKETTAEMPNAVDQELASTAAVGKKIDDARTQSDHAEAALIDLKATLLETSADTETATASKSLPEAVAKSTVAGNIPNQTSEDNAKALWLEQSRAEPTTLIHSTAGAAVAEASQIPTEASFTKHADAGGWKQLSKKKIFLGALLCIPAYYLAYYLYRADFNLSKAEWMIWRDLKNWFKGTGESGAALQSKFKIALSPETSEEIGLYFIYLDRDKENGVRRSDAIDLLEQLGFPNDTDSCRNFILQGPGRGNEAKRFSGCSLQEFAELIETSILEEEISKLPNKPEPSKWVLFGFDFKSLTREVTKRNNLLKAAKTRLQETLSEAEYRVQQKLKELNAKVLPASIPSSVLSLQSPFSTRVPTTLDAASKEETVDELELKKLELQTLEEVAKSLSNLQERRGLSDAETERLVDLKKSITLLERQIFEEEMELSMKNE